MDRRLVGTILVIVGILALIYGSFSYTRTTHDTQIGPVEVQVRDRERVDIPLWAGVAVAVCGAALLISQPQRRS
jgi:uncharacterized membrane protein YidH (DUF202 family)